MQMGWTRCVKQTKETEFEVLLMAIESYDCRNVTSHAFRPWRNKNLSSAAEFSRLPCAPSHVPRNRRNSRCRKKSLEPVGNEEGIWPRAGIPRSSMHNETRKYRAIHEARCIFTKNGSEFVSVAQFFYQHSCARSGRPTTGQGIPAASWSNFLREFRRLNVG